MSDKSIFIFNTQSKDPKVMKTNQPDGWQQHRPSIQLLTDQEAKKYAKEQLASERKGLSCGGLFPAIKNVQHRIRVRKVLVLEDFLIE